MTAFTETERQALLDEALVRAQRMLGERAALGDVLAPLTSVVEALSGGGSVASILVLDESGLLRNGASPNLPADYLRAIDRLQPNPNVGTCAAAAATARMVITPDFFSDGKWTELRHLPLALGFQGAWSMPILDAHSRVLGTFGTYFRERREPSPREIAEVARLVPVAAIAIEALRQKLESDPN